MESSAARIRVGVRIRPFIESERASAIRSAKMEVDSKENEIRVAHDDYKTLKSFRFDTVCDENCPQPELYDRLDIDAMINRMLDGFHATIFAYGQTGSGKTYTMEGYQYEVREKMPRPLIDGGGADRIGIIPRVISNLFDKIRLLSKSGGKSYTVYVSFLEIYNERIYDLLNPGQLLKSNSINPGLRLRWTKKDEFLVENLYIFECKTPQEVLNYFQSGIKNRIIASHKMNMASSRSHTIFTLKVEQFSPGTNSSVITSKLELVDLAGSERLNIIGAEGNAKLAKETIEINKSLFTLRQVISLVADMKNGGPNGTSEHIHVPYRESKLTCLLKHSIGGSSYCLMIACLAPGDNCFDENISTLTYATKASSITNIPTKNEDPKTQLINALKDRIARMTEELLKANEHIEFLSVVANERIVKFGNDFLPGGEPQTSNQTAEGGTRDGAQAAKMLLQQQQMQIQQAQQAAGRIPSQIVQPLPGSQPQQPPGPPPNNVRKTPQTAGSANGNNTTVLAETIARIANNSALENINANLLKLNNNIERTTAGTGDRINPSFLTERLVDSVNMVRELLHSNKEMRDLVEKLSRTNEDHEFEIGGLQRENEELREKVSILESLVSDETEYGPYRYEWLQKLLASDGTQQRGGGGAGLTAKVDLANEIVKLKQEKKALESRVRQLELDNMVLYNKISPNKNPGEPMRAMNTNNNVRGNAFSQTNGTPRGLHGPPPPISYSQNPHPSFSASRGNMGSRGGDVELQENMTNFGRKTLRQGRPKVQPPFQPAMDSQPTRFNTIPTLPPNLLAGGTGNKMTGQQHDMMFHHQIAHAREDSLPQLPDVSDRRGGGKYNLDHSFY